MEEQFAENQRTCVSHIHAHAYRKRREKNGRAICFRFYANRESIYRMFVSIQTPNHQNRIGLNSIPMHSFVCVCVFLFSHNVLAFSNAFRFPWSGMKLVVPWKRQNAVERVEIWFAFGFHAHGGTAHSVHLYKIALAGWVVDARDLFVGANLCECHSHIHLSPKWKMAHRRAYDKSNHSIGFYAFAM